MGILLFKLHCCQISHQETRDLLAYGQIIIELARKHAGMGWYTYDSLFRQQLNAGANLKWMDLNPSPMASTVLCGRGITNGGQMCSLCMASDHLATDCALASLETPRPITPSPRLPLEQLGFRGSKRPQPGYNPYPRPPLSWQ